MSDIHSFEGAGNQGAGEFTLFTRRMNSFDADACGVRGVRHFGMAVGSLAAFSLAVAVVFSALGAWLILPFAGLEAIALYWAFSWVKRHAQDSESLVIRGDAVVLAVREQAHTRRYEFNRAWARLVVQRRRWDVRLALRSHGNEVEVGRYLDGGGRQRLARELKARLQAR